MKLLIINFNKITHYYHIFGVGVPGLDPQGKIVWVLPLTSPQFIAPRFSDFIRPTFKGLNKLILI